MNASARAVKWIVYRRGSSEKSAKDKGEKKRSINTGESVRGVDRI